MTVQKPGDYGPQAQSHDPVGLFRKLFPNASEEGVKFEDLPVGARNIAKFLQGPRTGIVSSLVGSKGIKASIDYELHALEFNQAYWLRNFIKCLAISRLASNEIQAQSRFIDVGGGTGPFAAAAAEIAKDARITINDSSKEQEKLFKELRRHNLINQRITFRSQRVNLNFLTRNKTPRLFSYVLCENQELLATQAQVRNVIGELAVVVDYWQIIERIAEVSFSVGLHAKIISRIEIPLGNRLARVIGQDTITVSGGVFQR